MGIRRILASLLIVLPIVTSVEAAQGQENEVTRFLARLDVMPPESFRGLTIFPLQLRGQEDEADFASLQEAFRDGLIRVSDTGAVERVTMENLSRSRQVFSLSGEVILGGKQNRMLREDVLLPPESGPVAVPTYCVEKGRWVGSNDAKFGSGKSLSNYALRQRALAAAPQAEVWDQVEREQQRFGVDSATKDYEAVASSPAVVRELEDYRKAFVPVWRPRAVGIVVAQGNRIVSADVFCNTRLFWKLRDKLVDSYAFDCIRRFREVRPSLRQEDARDFMARIYDASFRERGSPGAGRKLDFSGNGIEGSALANRGAVVHFHVSPGLQVRPPEEPGPGLPIEPRPRRGE